MGNSIQKMAFMPPNPPTKLPIKYDYHWPTTKNQHQLPLIYFPYPKSKLTLVFSHGNGEDLGNLADYLRYLGQQLKVSIIAYEYLGYGQCKLHPSAYSTSCTDKTPVPKHPSEKGTYESINTAYHYITETLNIPAETLVFMGQSIGSGPTTNLCARKTCAGMILVTPFKSAAKVVTESSLAYPIDFFRNADVILEVNAPILIVHGTKDSVVPFKHGQELYQMILKDSEKSKKLEAPYPPVWIEGADHNDLDSFSQYYRGISNFLRYLEKKV